MKICTVDLETFWDVGHSLTKMSPIAYCMHPDTEIISCAFKFGNQETEVIFGEDEVKHHVLGTQSLGSYVSPAKGLGPPDALLVHRRPHFHLEQRSQYFIKIL